MESELMNLFATPLHKSSLNRSFTDIELQFIKNQLGDPVRAISNHSSRNKNVLNADEMQDIRSALEKSLADYFKRVFNTANKVVLEITQSWLTVTRQGESHHSHIHPNSIASGVLYINVAENDGINFYRNEDMLWYDLVREQENYYNASRYFINAKAGDIIIFPSNVHHGVNAVEAEFERVSLAFNSFFSGELGRDEFSNSLKISIG